MNDIKFERADWTSFRTLEGLQQKAGVALDGLVALVLKELADNALDAGAHVTVGEIGEGYFIQDDGPGIDPDEVARLFSIARPLTSSKMLRLPTRGALGNGLRVAAGAVLASGGKLAVETRGARVTLKPRHQDGTTASTRRAIKERAGTRIEISFGASLPKDDSALGLTQKAISLAKGGVSYAGQSSPYWYNGPQFHELLSASGATPVRQLIAELDGCAGGRAGEIVAVAGLGRKACNQIDAAGAVRLLKAARAVAKPVNPKRLGAIGAGHFSTYSYGVNHTEVRFGTDPAALIPAVVEVWVSPSSALRAEVSVNRTPIAAHVSLQKDKSDLDMFGCGLAHNIGKTAHKGVVLHLNVMTPYMPITSDGKEPNLKPFLSAICAAAGQAIRKMRRPPRVASTQKDVVLANLAAAINEVSEGGKYRFNERNLFYRLRPIVQEELDQELKIGNFKSIIDDYENEHGEIRLMYRDPRGSLVHPHHDEVISLGTLMVEKYERPAWLFNKLLYIEKEGAHDSLKQDGWLEKHDCAVMSTKGFSTRAARDLIDKLAAHGEPIKVFCVHDADASGSMIYQTLQEATKARRARKIEIINLGLEPWEAVEMGLNVEDLPEAKNRRPVADYIEDHDGDWGDWLQSHRVELNEMTPAQLIAWLDEKMEQHGDGKLIPPDDVLEDTNREATEKRLREEITEEILRDADLDGRVAAALAAADLPSGEKLREQIEEAFVIEPAQSWRDVIDPADDEEEADAGDDDGED